jgi:hypothetical protein
MVNSKKYIFPVSPLYIQLDTNTGTNGNSEIHLFKRSMLKMPKMNTDPILTSEYPFFTKNVRYPSSIQRATWKTKYEFFFNRVIFIDRLRKEIELESDSYRERLTSKDPKDSKELYEWMKDTERHNIMITLRSLFPIPESFGKILKTSYDNILKSDYNNRIIWDVNVRSAVNIFGFMYKFGIMNKEKEEYFININGKKYEVDDVIWENDVVNHPIYRKFLKSQRETYEEAGNSKLEVEEKRSDYLKKLNDSLDDMRTKEQFQRDFFKFSGKCIDEKSCKNENALYTFLKEMKNAQNTDAIGKKYIFDPSNNSPYVQIKYLIHKYYARQTIEVFKDDEDEDEDEKKLKSVFESIEKLGVDARTNSLIDLSNNTEMTNIINENYNEEIFSMFNIKQSHEDETEDVFEQNLFKRIETDLKGDSFFMLRMHILSKNPPTVSAMPGPIAYNLNINNDRRTTASSISDKLKRLYSENSETAANTIISIKEDLDNHQILHSNEGIGVFMEKDYELLFDRLLKNAIDLKASSIVSDFVNKNIPMNLTGKKVDGTDVSKVNQRINQYVRDFFGTEASINNRLSSNVNDVFEPVRKTSNRELYKVLKLFKFGDAIMKRDYKMSNSEINTYRDVLDHIHNKYIATQDKDDYELDDYLYTGVDEVKSTAGTGEVKSITGEEVKQPESESRRNVHEIYVRFDLVDSETLEKLPRANCKLFDKEMEQEFKYLADPRNKTNATLSIFRNFGLDTKQSESESEKEPTNTESNPAPPNKRNGGETRNIYLHVNNGRKTRKIGR